MKFFKVLPSIKPIMRKKAYDRYRYLLVQPVIQAESLDSQICYYNGYRIPLWSDLWTAGAWMNGLPKPLHEHIVEIEDPGPIQIMDIQYVVSEVDGENIWERTRFKDSAEAMAHLLKLTTDDDGNDYVIKIEYTRGWPNL